MKGKMRNWLLASGLALSLSCAAVGAAAFQSETLDVEAATMATVIAADFEDQSTSGWSSNGNCTQTVVESAHGGSYALKSTLNEGCTQNRIQTAFSTNKDGLQPGKWYEFECYLKADEATTMNAYLYFNSSTGAKELLMASGTAVGTDWTHISFGVSYQITANGCELSFRRPNMSSPATHTFTGMTDVTSFDFFMMTSVQTWYMDDFTISTEKEDASYDSAALSTDFENGSVAPWTGGSYSTLGISDDAAEGSKSMRVARNSDGGQNRFQTNIPASSLKEGVWTTLSFDAKASEETGFDVVIYFNHTGGSPQYLYWVNSSGNTLTTDWKSFTAGLSFQVEGDTLSMSFQRPNMTSPAAHSVVVGEGSQLTSIDIVFMTSVQTMWFDDIQITQPFTVSAEAGEVIDMIDALGTITADSKAAVNAAAAAYEALTDEQKAEVFNYDVLQAAQREVLLLGGLTKGEFDEENVVFRFGAISDTHNHNTEKALQVLQSWGGKEMDALIMAGDITDRTEYDNNLREIPLVKACFENNLADDIEMFFCLGNHDSSNGSHAADFYDGLGERFYRSYLDKEYTRQTGNGHAVIGGYHFIAIETDYTTETVPAATMEYLETTLESIVSDEDYNGEYIFIVSHVSMKGTVAGASPITTMTELVSQYPQVVMLTGHSHSTLYNEMAIMQTDFTTVNLGSVSYTPFEGQKYLESLDYGLIEGSYDLSVGTMMEVDKNGNLKITRIDFAKEAEIGEAWILPAPTEDKSHLFAYPQERKTIFAEAPTWENPEIVAKKISGDAVEITFDTATDDSYVHSYLIELFVAGASEPYYSIESLSGFYHYPQASDMPKTKTVTLTGLKQLPASVRITPKDSIDLTAASYTADVEKSENVNVVPTSVLVFDTDAYTYALESKYELSIDEAFETLLPNEGSIREYIGSTLYVREKENDFIYASAVTAIEIVNYTLTFPTSENYTVYVDGEKDSYFVNEVVEFSVGLSAEYANYGVIVKLGDTLLTADKDGIYQVVMNANGVITVELTEPEKYTVTLPSVKGATIEKMTAETEIEEGKTFSFKVKIAEGYTADSLVVKANGKTLTAKDGVYTVTVTEDITVTVSGVSAIPAPVEEESGCGSVVGISVGVTLLAACVAVVCKRKKD
ncbi:MAG: hypothetical protein E7380_03785 [Clostridiales bacterium]|nr:hypothetical protein [Clostridiales bacterium]